MMQDTSRDDQLLRSLPHLTMDWNSPLSPSHADRLLSALRVATGSRLIDLGCGWGGLLLRALRSAADAVGEGVDRNPASLARGRSSARAMGLAERVRFLELDLLEYRGIGDRAICIGADHVWGGARGALRHLTRRVSAGGTLLFGGGHWAAPPSPAHVAMFGELPASFGEICSLARTAGWELLSADAADPTEWDEFETSWTEDLYEIARTRPHTPLARRALRLARQRREEYEHGYRGVLGFAYLVLERAKRPARGVAAEREPEATGPREGPRTRRGGKGEGRGRRAPGEE